MKTLLYISLFMLLGMFGYSQCYNCTANYPGGTFSTTSTSLVTINTCIYGGEYSYYSVTAGETYTWTTCGDVSFDTQLTLFTGVGCGGVVLGYDDDDPGCGLQSTITWAATFTGNVTVLVSAYNCIDIVSCMTLQWACITCSVPGAPGANCGNAIIMACGDVLINETTVGNTDANNSWDCHLSGPPVGIIATPGEDTYYVVQWTDPAVGGTIRFTLTNVSDISDSYLEFIMVGAALCDNTCDNSTQLDISTGLFLNNTTSVDYDVGAGITNYYFVVDGQIDGIDSYDIEVTCFTTGIDIDQNNNCGAAFNPGSLNEGLYTTWNGIQAPLTYDATLGGTFTICENIYIENAGWEWLKYYDILIGSCWTNITNIIPNGVTNGFRNVAGSWTASLTGNTISWSFINSVVPAWGDGINGVDGPYTCLLYSFCFTADVDPTCIDVNGFQNIISATDDGIGGAGGATEAANILISYTYAENTSTLPVDLINFSGICNIDMIILNWKTASEINNDYFTIEKSIDGINFNYLSTISGNGNSNELLDYTYTDFDSGNYYYRLKQTDFDGTDEYHNTVYVSCDINQGINFYPNPTKCGESTNISGTYYTISITDIIGRTINADITDNVISGLPCGIYIITVDGKYRTKLIIK